ncbi:bacillithiol biosynthesis deacetylase BshB1 [Paenibacillus sp. 1001270B_150601_E10]|uniref:bacillithiol biosynthesis deacetylase BshB1 n=1 Tax=Paenibacillus sp. 1001270B_150601_E10 TaxID=2787079 RepID=UPI00189E7F6A|nr:bacillithiol biosynthesis deacetylase BshB1 [Paenibacillus sp. 1001270B_150601_E10]
MIALDILAIGAHPDDVEIGMAGTLAKHKQAGYKTGIYDLTYAEMSSNGTVELRQEEAKDASQILQLDVRGTIGLPDRGLQLIKTHIDEVVKIIRWHKPRIVFAPYWEDRHPDHIMCSRIVQEALFNAKLRRYMPELPAHTVEQAYFYFINDTVPADLVVDVSEVYEQKRLALGAYRSQFTPQTNEMVSTPLTQGYVERVEARDSLLGQGRGMKLAEGFITKGPYAVQYF